MTAYRIADALRRNADAVSSGRRAWAEFCRLNDRLWTLADRAGAMRAVTEAVFEKTPIVVAEVAP